MVSVSGVSHTRASFPLAAHSGLPCHTAVAVAQATFITYLYVTIYETVLYHKQSENTRLSERRNVGVLTTSPIISHWLNSHFVISASLLAHPCVQQNERQIAVLFPFSESRGQRI
jgi:hypothetical protein